MIYSDRIVPIPTDKHVIFKSYVYLTVESTYMPEKKYNTHKRVSIGKAIDDSTMHPNSRYYEFYPDPDALDEPDPESSDVQRVGAKAAVEALFISLKLDSTLSDVFDSSTAHMIHDLASYMCLSAGCAMQHYPSWRYDHPGFADTNVCDTTVSRFFKNDISWKDTEKFLKKWNEGRDKDCRIYVNFDSTNFGTEAQGVELAEFGYAKDDPTIPQINLAVAAQTETGLPLMYDLYAGSITDVSEVSYVIQMAQRFGYENLGFIFDRGYLSQANVHQLREMGYDFLIMLKSSNACARRAISMCHDQLKNGWDPRLLLENDGIYGMTVEDKLFAKDDRKSWIHVFYDPKREFREKAEFMQELKVFEDQLKEGIQSGTLNEETGKKFAHYYDLKLENGIVTGYQINRENVEEKLSMLGCFAICSTEEMSAQEALDNYRQRDAVEKLFESIKSEMGARRPGVYLDESLNSKIFVLFIAAIIRSQIFYQLKPLRKSENERKKYTVPAVIHELEKIIAIRNEKGKFERRRCLTGTQKKILKQFGISEAELDDYVKKI